jgi:hypothetical protein
MVTPNQHAETPRVPLPLPGLNHRLTPEQLAVMNWQRFRETLDALTLDQVLKVLQTCPSDLAEYLHFVMGGRP